MHQSRATGVRGVAPRSRSRTGRRPSAGRASGGGGKSKLSDELGYASGGLRAPDNRRFRLVSISARNVQPSGSRRAVIKRPRLRTHSCLKIRGSWVRNPRGAARARGVPFRFGSRDGDASSGGIRRAARRTARDGEGGVQSRRRRVSDRGRGRDRSIDRSVGRSSSSEYARRFRRMMIRAARKTPTNGTSPRILVAVAASRRTCSRLASWPHEGLIR